MQSKGKCGQPRINSHIGDTNYHEEAFKSKWQQRDGFISAHLLTLIRGSTENTGLVGFWQEHS